MRALIVGLGAIGQRHARNLRTLLGGSVELLAYRVRRLTHSLTDRLEIEADVSVEEKLGVHSFFDLDEVLRRRPNVAFICNPTSLHLPVAMAAAEAGCHLLLEKPISHDLQGVDELISLVERKRLTAMVAYQMRFHPILLRLRELLATRAVGNVIAVHAENGEYLPGWHPYEDYRQSYAARAELGGGVVRTQIHELDYLLWLFGSPKGVFAVGGQLSSLEIDVEDSMTVLMNCESANGKALPVQLHQDYLQRPPVRTCRVQGDAGVIVADFREWKLQRTDAAGTVVEECAFPAERNQLYRDELRHFLGCVESGNRPMVDLREGRRSLALALAVLRSARTGRSIDDPTEGGGER